MTRHSLKNLLPLLLALAAGCAAVTPQIDAEPTAEPADAGPGAIDAGVPAVDAGVLDAGPSVVAPPQTPEGERLAWVLSMINGGISTTTDAQLEAQFTPAFLAVAPVSVLRSVFTQFAAKGPFLLRALEGAPGPHQLAAVLSDARGMYWRVNLALSATQGNRLEGLFFAPAGDADPTLDSWEKLEPALTALAPKVGHLEADVTAGVCQPLHAINPQQSVALGSAFKLYVLTTLGRQIEAGTRSWTDPLAIRDDWKSLPSGKMQDAPVGTSYTLQKYAEQMISISDNTATDHLLRTLGRTEVERSLTATLHHAPASTLPFLTTRELFVLKLMLTPLERQGYIEATVDARRSQLETYATRDPRTYKGSWTAPKQIEQLEWFASPEDICRVFLELKRLGSVPATAPVLSILSVNGGIPANTDLFSYVGFKGGSEPGVMTFNWLVQRKKDGAWRVVSIGFNDPLKAIDEERAVYLVSAARALAGR